MDKNSHVLFHVLSIFHSCWFGHLVVSSRPLWHLLWDKKNSWARPWYHLLRKRKKTHSSWCRNRPRGRQGTGRERRQRLIEKPCGFAIIDIDVFVLLVTCLYWSICLFEEPELDLQNFEHLLESQNHQPLSLAVLNKYTSSPGQRAHSQDHPAPWHEDIRIWQHEDKRTLGQEDMVMWGHEVTRMTRTCELWIVT